MQKLPGKRALALVAGLTVATAGAAVGQDTTETGRAAIDTTAPTGGALDTAGVDTSAARDTTDTSGVQNPPGYRGMERDTTIFPDEGGPPAEAGQVEDRATGTYDDSAWQDTSGAAQNPAGYRGMERPVGRDTTAGGATGDTGAAGAAGDTTDTSGVQNPPGYRGMERDTTIFPDEGGPPAEAGQTEDRATGTYDDSAWQDTSGAAQNPAGYRGMERPAGADTSATSDTSAGASGEAGDTADTTSTRFGSDSTHIGDADHNQ